LSLTRVGLNELFEERSHLAIGKARGHEGTQVTALEFTPSER
jgi:hypothetical protein